MLPRTLAIGFLSILTLGAAITTSFVIGVGHGKEVQAQADQFSPFSLISVDFDSPDAFLESLHKDAIELLIGRRAIVANAFIRGPLDVIPMYPDAGGLMFSNVLLNGGGRSSKEEDGVSR